MQISRQLQSFTVTLHVNLYPNTNPGSNIARNFNSLSNYYANLQSIAILSSNIVCNSNSL